MRKNRWLSSLYVWLVMLFLYAPIAVLIVFSFNDSKSRNTWTGFTLRWYEELFHDRVIIQSFVVMLVVAIASSVCQWNGFTSANCPRSMSTTAVPNINASCL